MDQPSSVATEFNFSEMLSEFSLMNSFRVPYHHAPKTTPRSHVAPILPTDVEQRIRDLAEARDLHGLHQFLEHVPA